MNHPNSSILILLLCMIWMNSVICYKNNRIRSNTLNSYNFYYPMSSIILWRNAIHTINSITSGMSKSFKIVKPIDPPGCISLNNTSGAIKINDCGSMTKQEFLIEDENGFQASVSITILDNYHYDYTHGIGYNVSQIKYSDCPITNPHIIQSTYGYIPYVDYSIFEEGENGIKSLFRGIVEKNYTLMLLDISGYLNITESGDYTFYMRSSYNGKLIVNGKEIINNENECIGYDKEYSNSINLNYGKNIYNLKVYVGEKDKESRGGWKFKINYKKSSETEVHDIDSILYETIYTTTENLLFEKHQYGIGLNREAIVPFTIENSDTNNDKINCEIKPSLPQRSYISVTTKTLHLFSSTEISQEYEMKCFSFTTVSNIIKLHLRFTNKLTKGLVGYYMKSDNFPIALNEPMNMNDESVHLNILRVEENINEKYTEESTIWSGLSSKFINEFGSSYGEYLVIDEERNYKFQLSCENACWLKIDNKEFMSIYGKSEEKYRSKTNTIKLSKGKHDFQLNYLQYNEGKGLEIFLLNEETNKWEYPSEYFYYTSPNEFIYEYTHSIYIKDESIITNKPILDISSSETPIYYSIFPNLPKGLELNEKSGEIYGKPIEYSFKQYYEVECFMNNNTSIKTEISITIEEIGIPSGIYLLNLDNGEIYNENELDLTIGFPIKYKIDSTGYSVEEYNVLKICKGLEYDKSNRIIKGNVMNDSNCEMSIEGINKAGSAIFNMKVNLKSICENDHLSYFEIIGGDSSIEVNLKDKNNNILFSDFGLNSEWYKYLCLKEDDYKFDIKESMSILNEYEVIIKYDGGIIYNKIKKGSSSEIIEIELSVSIPIVSYPESIAITRYEVISIKPNIQHNYSFSISPKLIDSLNLNNETGEISGYIGYLPKNIKELKFNISIENDFGIVLKEIIIKIEENTCENEGKILLRIEIKPKDKGYNMYFNIKDENKNVIYSINGSELIDNKPKYIVKCINEGIYDVNYGTSDTSGDLWNDGYLNVYQNDGIMGKYVMQSRYTYQKFVPFYSSKLYLYYWVNSLSEWQYSTEYEENWNKPEKSVDWSKSKLSDLKVDKDVLYLRIEHARPDNFDDYTSFYNRLKVLSGIKYYINGDEIFQYFIDDEKDTSSGKFSELQEMRFIFPISSIENGVVIGIELHREKSETNFPSFEYIGFALEGDDKSDCTSLNSFGYEILDYSPHNSDSDPSEALKEGDVGWRGKNDDDNPIYFTYKFGDFSYFVENTYEYSGDIGNLENIDIVDINNISSSFTKTDRYNYKEIDYNKSSLYYQNKVSFTKVTNFVLNKFELSVCRIFECEKDCLTNSVISFECPVVPYFRSEIKCPFGKNTHFDGSFRCTVGPDRTNYKLDDYTFYLGEEGVYIELYETHIEYITPTVTPPLPPCIIHDFLGFYYSKCKSEYEKTEYTFQYCNNTHTMTIEVKAPNHPYIIMKKDNPTFIIKQENENIELFDIFGDDYEISISPKLPSGLNLIENDKTVSINGNPDSISLTRHIISFITPTYSKMITISVNCIIPKVPILVDTIDNYNLLYGYNYADLTLFHVLGVNLLYSVEPDLPKSLILNSATGKINGQVTETPSSFQPTLFNFKVNNNELIIPITLSIVESDKPIIMNYESEKGITIGLDVQLNLFTVLGKDIEYSVIPKLPLGLELSKSTGIISGKVSEKVNDKMYTFMFKNAKGSSFVSILLKFKYPLVPMIVKYEKEKTFYKNVPINSYSLFTAVGENLKYECKDILPSGLLLLESSGVIVGTANRKVEKKEYEFVVSNENGFDSIKISIEIDILYCKNDNKWSNCEILNKCYVKCDGIKNGNYERECDLNKDNEAEWLEEINGCEINTSVLIAILIPCIFCFLLLSLIIIFIIYRRNAILRVNEDRKKSSGGRINANDSNPIRI